MTDRRFYSLVFVVLSAASLTAACKCKPSTENEVYCQARWISHLKVKAKRVSTDKHTHIYDVQQVDVFKKPEDMEELPEEVLSPAFSGACGITELAPGQEYLIAGTVANGRELRAVSCLFFSVPGQTALGSVSWPAVDDTLKAKLTQRTIKC